MDTDTSSTAPMIVRSVVDLATNLGIPVVAEGVETDAARIALRGLGCQYGQGYLFSRPVAAADFGAWLTGQPTRAQSSRSLHTSGQLRALH